MSLFSFGEAKSFDNQRMPFHRIGSRPSPPGFGAVSFSNKPYQHAEGYAGLECFGTFNR